MVAWQEHDFESKRRQRRISNSQPLTVEQVRNLFAPRRRWCDRREFDWFGFLAWIASIIAAGLVCGFALALLTGRM